ncbi:hypothetical protein [Catellatospora sichuanensis]|uniref:hypothetical protein n=1 Tax=Catellatospora sichuanensis TaxID=1969805 RepID=UPI0011845F26|nr:hypothetical protein [Catellatospora sichuanensis]
MKHRNSRMLLTVLGLSGRGPARRDAPNDSGGTDGGGGGDSGGDGGDGKGGSGTGDDGKNPQIKGDRDPDRVEIARFKLRSGRRRHAERFHRTLSEPTSVPTSSEKPTS